nr:thyroglobulin-like isoform X2 [Pocillopora verrucosa]
MNNLKLGFVLIVIIQATLLSAVKDGLCPRASPYGPCVTTCGADEDCDGSKKCCSNGCGSWCLEPMCPSGQQHVDCPAQLCNYAGCPDKPQESLRCVVESCGKCSVKFINKTTGQTVNCGPVETLCKRMLAATHKKPLLLGQYVPSCDANGHFIRVQSHEAYFFCVDDRGIPDFSTRSRTQPKCPELSLCQKKRKEAEKLPPLGSFVPQCKSDGSFKEKQCHSSTGQCWCVDQNGHEWSGTRTRGDLDCTTSVCPVSVRGFDCDPMLCNTASCPAHKDATCRVNTCGKCEVEFLDKNGRKVDCFSKCQNQRLKALGTHSLDEKPAHPIIGRFVPQCAEDGSYEEVQCYGSTGYCWCVDVVGNPVVGTMNRGLPHCNKTAMGVCSGKPMFTCLRNFCQWSTCPAHPEAKCRINPCGGCKVEFIDKNSKVVDCHEGLSKCKLQEKKASAFSGSGLQPVGRFVPKCEADGSYSKIQCWSSTGYCWCVDKNGTELQGTRVRGMPVCPSQGRSKRSIKDGFCPIVKQPRTGACSNKCSSDNECQEMQKCCNVSGCGLTCQEPSFTTCPNGKPFLLCLHMCQFARCPAYPKATCFSDPCKMCKVEFHDEQGNIVNCTKGLTRCQARQKLSTGMLGEFVPKCKSDGSFEPVQSHEGYFWCVDADGKEVNGTRRHFQKPTCLSQLKSSLTLCQLQTLQSGGTPMPGRYIPQCKADGSFEEVQCHPSTGYCWCVNTQGWEIKGTKVRGRPTCSKVCAPVVCRMYCEFGWAQGPDGCDICKCKEVPIKPGFCPAVEPDQVATCTEKCSTDNDCLGNQKCCSNDCGRVCTAPEYKAKPGYCPAVDIHHVGICKSECSSDRDCQGEQKCCGNGCGRVCSAPVREACPRGAPFIMCHNNPCERASCPANPKAKCLPDNCGGCNAQFFDDNDNIVDCLASATKCQKEYLDATASPGMVGQFVPKCAADGSYAPVQCHGSIGFCWCVDRDGKELPNTRVRGQPKCATKCQKEYLDATASPGMVGQFVPKCAADGSYAPVQCHASIGFCWCVDRDGKELPNTRVRGQPKCSTKCQKENLNATQNPLIGGFVPKCNADGSYAPVQCHGSIGFCWCVDKDGKEIPDTRIRGRPTCAITFSIGPSCDDGKTWQLCGDTCKNASCTSNPDANCVAPMGGCGPDACKPKFYNRMGKEAQCLTECQQKAYQATHPALVGAFIPQCNADGSYALVQCWGSTGYCWCASEDGSEWPGTRVRGKPNCDANKGPQLLSVHVGLTFNYSLGLVKDVLGQFKESVKTQMITMFSLKENQLHGLEVQEGSILVGFSVEPASGGKDLRDFADEITEKARNHELVIEFSGITFVAEPEVMLASPMYVEEKTVSKKQEETASSSVSVTSVAFISVFCTLAVVAVALVAFKLIQKKRRSSGLEERRYLLN